MTHEYRVATSKHPERLLVIQNERPLFLGEIPYGFLEIELLKEAPFRCCRSPFPLPRPVSRGCNRREDLRNVFLKFQVSRGAPTFGKWFGQA